MRDDSLKRRDFHKMTMAAFGGLMAGASTNSSKANAAEQDGNRRYPSNQCLH